MGTEVSRLAKSQAQYWRMRLVVLACENLHVCTEGFVWKFLSALYKFSFIHFFLHFFLSSNRLWWRWTRKEQRQRPPLESSSVLDPSLNEPFRSRPTTPSSTPSETTSARPGSSWASTPLNSEIDHRGVTSLGLTLPVWVWPPTWRSIASHGRFVSPLKVEGLDAFLLSQWSYERNNYLMSQSFMILVVFLLKIVFRHAWFLNRGGS